MRSLNWGHRYLTVSPDHFRIDYVINPYMDPTHQPDPAMSLRQWSAMVRVLEQAGAQVDVLEQGPGLPDMVFAMNLGLVLGDTAVLSSMRHPERRGETPLAQRWFEEAGFAVHTLGEGVAFEAGDVFAYGDGLLAGFGPRTQVEALPLLARALDVRVRGFELVHPGMYHFDLAFCPLDDEAALVCPAALAPDSASALLELIPDPCVLTEAEALEFTANSVVVDRTVVMPACPPRVRRFLESRGFEVRLVALGEFHRAGGSARCLTNPLDLQAPRDLPVVPGGAVVLPQRDSVAA